MSAIGPFLKCPTYLLSHKVRWPGEQKRESSPTGHDSLLTNVTDYPHTAKFSFTYTGKT